MKTYFIFYAVVAVVQTLLWRCLMVDLVDLVVDVGDLPQLEGLGELTLKPFFILCVPTVVKN